MISTYAKSSYLKNIHKHGNHPLADKIIFFCLQVDVCGYSRMTSIFPWIGMHALMI